MATMGRWAGFWTVVVACFGFVAYVALTGTRTTMSADTTTFQTRTVASPSTGPSASTGPRIGLFVGDSYVAGTATVAQRSTFAPRACNRLAMICYYDAEPGTGYLSDGASVGSYPQRLRADRKYTPDLVVVEGGRADLGAGPVEDTATAYFRALRKQFRTAKILVLEPFWNNATPPATVQALRLDVKRAADAAGVQYVPTTDWLTDDLMSADGITPGARGHVALASRVVPVLRRALA